MAPTELLLLDENRILGRLETTVGGTQNPLTGLFTTRDDIVAVLLAVVQDALDNIELRLIREGGQKMLGAIALSLTA